MFIQPLTNGYVIMNEESYRGKYGLLHANIPSADCDDNSILYDVENITLKQKLGILKRSEISDLKIKIKIHEISKGVFAQTPDNKLDPASHDNVTAIISASKRYGFSYHKELKIAGKFWHPRDVIFYNYCKGGLQGFIAFFFLWFVLLDEAVGMLTKYKYRPNISTIIADWIKKKPTLPGQPDSSFNSMVNCFIYRFISVGEWYGQRKMIKTDGELLFFVKVNNVKLPIMKYVNEKLMKKKFGDKPYTYAFSVFCPEGHPNRLLAKKLGE